MVNAITLGWYLLVLGVITAFLALYLGHKASKKSQELNAQAHVSDEDMDKEDMMYEVVYSTQRTSVALIAVGIAILVFGTFS